MTQVTNYTVANLKRAEVRQAFNAVLAALRDDNAGPTEPPNPVPGMWWRDTSVSPSQLKLRNDANSAWLLFELPTLASLGITAKAAQINPLDGDVAAGNSILMRENVNLSPAAADFTAPQWVKTSAIAGITYTVTTGRDERGQFIDYRLSGSYPDASYPLLFNASEFVAITNGQPYTVSAEIEKVAGSWTGVVAVLTNIVSATSSDVYVTQTNDSKATPLTGPINFAATRTFTGPTEAKASPQIMLVLSAGTAVDVTLRIRGLQLEQGAARQEGRYLPATPAQVRKALGLPARDFVSADLSFTYGTALTVAHGLGGVPKAAEVWLKCVTSEYGYAVGARIKMPAAFLTGGLWWNATWGMDATSVSFWISTAGLSFVAADGTPILLTPANWRIVVEASL